MPFCCPEELVVTTIRNQLIHHHPPRLLIALAMFDGGVPAGGIPRPPRSTGLPSFSQRTACAREFGTFGGRMVSEHEPEPPIACPCLLIPQLNETVSPESGSRIRISSFGSHITPLKSNR